MKTNDGSSTKDTNITNTTGLTQTGTNVRPSTNTFKTKTAKPEHDTKATQSYITMDFDPPTTMKEEQDLLSAMYASACVPNTMRMSYDMVEDMLTDHIDLMEGDDLEICNKDTELISI